MKTQTVNIALPRNLVKETDKLAEEEYRNRSELIREALRDYLNKRRVWEEITKRAKEQARKVGVKNEKDVDRIVYEFRHWRKKN